MQTAKQLSVNLVNKPGRLAAMLVALNKGKVGLRALSVMDTGDRGTLRFVPDDFVTAREVLSRASVHFEVTDVLVIDVQSQSGAFRKICERLAADHLNINYAYSSFDSGQGVRGGALAVIKVNDLTKAQRVLSENGNSAARRKLPRRRPVHAR